MFYVQETSPYTNKNNDHKIKSTYPKKKHRIIRKPERKKVQIMFAPASRFAQQNQLNHEPFLYACKKQATRTKKKELQFVQR